MTNEANAIDRKAQDICAAQRAFMSADLSGDRNAWSEYEAIVDLFAMNHEMPLREAYELIENGPVIFA
jgi:hypothetical protein